MMHANGTYDFPFGKGKRFANQGGALDKVVGGWTMGTIITYQTGAPYQLVSGYGSFNGPACSDGWCTGAIGDGGVKLTGATQSDLQSSVGVYRTGLPFADTVGTQYLTSPTTGGSNRSIIAANTTAGIIGYHPWLWGPRRFFQDLAITKSIPIRENLRFSFQAEFLNVWNHPVWGSPTANILSNGFGHSTVITNPGARQIELRANIEF
jgi:hypothetical protein